MKTCPGCQAEVNDNAKFCIKCGFNIKKHEEEKANQEYFCPECGTKFSGGVFCPECGYNISNDIGGTAAPMVKGFDFGSIEALEKTAKDQLEQQKAEEEAKRKAAEEESRRKAAEEEARRKAAEEEARRKVAEEEARRKAAEEEARRKAAGEEARRKAAELARWSIGNNHIFGSYYQINESSKNPIEWIVIAREGNKALLISKYALYGKQYNSDGSYATWETSTLRKWLNKDFLNEAFNESEQEKIQTTYIQNPSNSFYNVRGGNATNDKIFLLSIDEARKFFNSNSARLCVPTAHAISQGLSVSASGGNCFWWLRSPGYAKDYASCVFNDGRVISYGHSYTTTLGIRPALWISI